VARDRQRAKQRRARREATREHASVERQVPQNPQGLDQTAADEFEAALIGGAGAEPLDDDEASEGPTDGRTATIDGAPVEHPDELGDEEFDELEDEVDELAEGRQPTRRATTPAAKPAEHRGLISRFIAFLGASWAELQRVQWPDRRQVAQATGVVLGFVIIAGLYLGVADWAAKKVVDFILG
jgi:preprotein translocase SecE subunit